MSANFWFATAKVVNYFELCKKSYFFVVFKAVYVDYVGEDLIKFQSTAVRCSELCTYCACIVRLLCVNSACIVRKIQEKCKHILLDLLKNQIKKSPFMSENTNGD